MRNVKSTASTILPLIIFLFVISCSSSNSGMAKKTGETISSVITPTSRPDWKQKQLDEEQEKYERGSYWQQNNAIFREAIKLGEPEGGLDEVFLLLLAT